VNALLKFARKEPPGPAKLVMHTSPFTVYAFSVSDLSTLLTGLVLSVFLTLVLASHFWQFLVRQSFWQDLQIWFHLSLQSQCMQTPCVN